ncbi:TPA: hypothetical protein RPV44_000495 [Escherichia coli]|nr:hypothetical protein [Escherichia coli]
MNIVYVIPLEMNVYSGVLQKVRQQIHEWEKQGNFVKCYYISNSSLNKKIHLYENEYIISYNVLAKFKMGRTLTRALAIRHLRRKLNKNEIDVLYYRYVFWFPGICGFLKKYNSIIEMNSHDINEFEAKSWLLKLIYKPIRRMILSSSNAAISVSEDIQCSLCNYIKNNYVIPNGFEFNKMETNRVQKNRNKRIVFVSTPGQYWQGIDIMISIMKKLNDYKLDIVGWTYDDYQRYYSDFVPGDNVFFHGYMQRDELEMILKSSGYAFNALAMYRKGMNYNSALKTAEYLNQNLPIISGYIETGLKTDAILTINTQNEVDSYIHKIESFLNDWSDKDISLSNIRSQIGIECTESARIEVFKKSLDKHGK